MQLAIGAYTATSAAGVGVQALQDSIENRQTGLRRNDLQNCDIDTWVGRVDGVEDISLPSHLDYLFSRNNQLAWLGLQQDGLLQSVAQLADSVGVDRVGVIMGTSTSSIGRTEEAYRHLLPSGQVAEEYHQESSWRRQPASPDLLSRSVRLALQAPRYLHLRTDGSITGWWMQYSLEGWIACA